MKTQSFGRFQPCKRGYDDAPLITAPSLPCALYLVCHHTAGWDANSALKDYRAQRENGDKRDDPKAAFPAAGFDGLDIEMAGWQGSSKWPDKEGRYWWTLTCKDGREINDYYWMKDEVRGFPDKADSEHYWFSVHHAPSGTKIEGFSARPDREKGYPDKDGKYWSYIQYDECGAIKEWMEEKDRNYLERLLREAKPVVEDLSFRAALAQQSEMRFDNTLVKVWLKQNVGFSVPTIELSKEELKDPVERFTAHAPKLSDSEIEIAGDLSLIDFQNSEKKQLSYDSHDFVFSAEKDKEEEEPTSQDIKPAASNEAVGKTPLPLDLARDHLGRLLGYEYQHLLQAIQALKTPLGEPALREDKHSPALAGLYALLSEYPPDDVSLQKNMLRLLADCLPSYHFTDEIRPLKKLKVAQKRILLAIAEVKQAGWSRKHTALGYLEQISNHYHSALDDFIAAVAEPQRLTAYQQQTSCALLGVGYYQIHIDTARKILCLNSYGDTVKANEAGSHAVCAANGVHYKPNPKLEKAAPVAAIKPGKEYAVSGLMQLIAGNQLAAAPSTLVSIRQLTLAARPDSPNLNPQKIDGLVQAGLSIEGMCFKDFLECRAALKLWQSRLPAEAVIALLEDNQAGLPRALAVAQEYFSNLFMKDMELVAQGDALRKAFEALCIDKPENERLLDIQFIMAKAEHNRPSAFWNECCEYLLRFTGTLEGLKILLGVLYQYPALMAGQRTSDVLDQLKQVKRLFKLFPNTEFKTAIQTLPELLTEHYLDQEATSALWIGLLLSLPCDAKFDNFMLQLHYDAEQQVQSCRIVAIDNDLSLRMPFSRNEEGTLCLETKNLLIALPELMEQPLHPQVQKRLLSTSAHSQWLSWVCLLAKRDSDYNAWQLQGTVAESALAAIDIPVKLSRQVLAFIKTQWQALQEFIAARPNITHRDCLEHLYPAVYAAYQGLQAISAEPLVMESNLYKIFSQSGNCPVKKLMRVEEHIEEAILAQCEIENILISTLEQARTELSRIDWTALPASVHWPLVEAFALLPSLTLQDWQGATEQDLKPLIQAWFREAVTKAAPFVAYRLLAIGANVNAVDESKQTALHQFCRQYLGYPNSKVVELMAEVLCSHHSCQLNTYNAHGYTPLLQWINVTPEPDRLTEDEMKRAEAVLDILLHYGANLEAKDSVKHETVLDKTLKPEQEKFTWLIRLVEKGAGYHVNSTSFFEFMQGNKERIEASPGLQDAIHRLVRRNLGLRWLLSLDILQLKKSSVAEMPVWGIYSGEVYLPNAIRKTLLTAEQQFNAEGQGKESYGRRVVQAITHQGVQWHLKENPEMPGIEYAVRSFSAALFGEHTAPHELFSFINAEKLSYPVLISQTVPGENLHTLLQGSGLKKDEVHPLRHLQPQFISEQIILAMLIHPEDGKPDNYQIIPLEDDGAGLATQYRIIGIDNDHAFVKAVDTTQGARKLQVKCVLFCLDEMRLPIHPAVRDRLLAISPESFLLDWLKKLNDYQIQATQLFRREDRSRFFKGNSKLKVRFGFQKERLPVVISIPFRAKAITELYDRFLQMQKQLRKTPTMTHLALLKSVTPILGTRYAEAFELYEEPSAVSERFKDLVVQSYSTAMAGHYKTLTTSKDAMTAMGIAEKEQKSLLTDEGQAALSPEAARVELQQAIQEKKRLKYYTEALLAGNSESFHRLLSEEMKQQIINSIDFATLVNAETKKPDSDKQNALLACILQENINFRHLRLQHCAALTDKHMKLLLSQSPDLSRLKLKDCPQITAATLKAVGRYTPNLVSLSLQGLPFLLGVGIAPHYTPLNLQQLERLHVVEAIKCTQIAVQSPRLTQASLHHNSALSQLMLDSPILAMLDVSHCPNFTKDTLLKIIGYYQSVPYLNLENTAVGLRLLQFISQHAHGPQHFREFSLQEWLEAEKNFNALERLVDLEHCQLDLTDMPEIHIRIIALLLAKNKSLKSLSFAGTPVSESAFKILFNALALNTSCEVLDLRATGLSEVTLLEIDALLDRNKKIGCIKLDVNPLEKHSKERLQHRLQQRNEAKGPIYGAEEGLAHIECNSGKLSWHRFALSLADNPRASNLTWFPPVGILEQDAPEQSAKAEQYLLTELSYFLQKVILCCCDFKHYTHYRQEQKGAELIILTPSQEEAHKLFMVLQALIVMQDLVPSSSYSLDITPKQSASSSIASHAAFFEQEVSRDHRASSFSSGSSSSSAAVSGIDCFNRYY